ncbi:cytochrome c oxidase accessory protein CcoG [Rubrivirga sp. IMCC45206]|uniref:cytochrome c oxidase accessory protein CcoG n=1 Tax=Rubrivirga sp. IMCC45206 TaxID=3391614 RepID=UPI00398FBA52
MPAFIPSADVGILDSPEEVLSTLRADGSRRWLYPTPSTGRFWRRRLVVGWGLIVFFVALPIVQIGGRPAVLLDLAAREFTLFGFTFYPTDTFLLLLVGIAILVTVALGTALLGRVWCGWGCPQTVYLEFFYRPVERFFEGAEHVRARRDAGPWSVDKAWRKAAKWTVYVVASALLAHTFTAYFVGWERLVAWMTGPPTEHWGYFVLAALTTGLVLFDFGVFREQMCTITCPYGRFQSILLDPDSLIVSYDPGRGEPRAKRGKKALAAERAGDRPPLGDCIDCGACVRTCPTGIDIRDGLQMECIACTQCIDACDDIMDAIDLPRGLIRYTSERALEGEKTRVVRGRTVAYGVLLVAVAALFTVALATRHAYDVSVARAVGDPYVVLDDGRIANRVRVRVRNQTATAGAFRVELASPADGEIRLGAAMPMAVAPGEMVRVEGFVVVPAAAVASGQAPATVRLVFANGTTREAPFTLLGPSR